MKREPTVLQVEISNLRAELKDKDTADTIEFEMIDGSEYELTAALHSLIDDKHGS